MTMPTLDPRVCYEAILSRDARFDGRFVVAVLTTGIYCRPSCPSRTPKAQNVHFYTSPAAAEGAGFRACKRCRPNQGADPTVAAEALRQIARPLDEPPAGVGGLADSLGLSARHLRRLLGSQVGLRPNALIRFVRLHAAVEILRRSDLPATEVAMAAGFSSLRALEQATASAFALSPSALRAAAAPVLGPAIDLRLSFRGPCDGRELLRFLAVRAVPGLEEADPDGAWYRRVLNLGHGFGIAEIRLGAKHVDLSLRLAAVEDLPEAVMACRRLLDLDADPGPVAAVLGADPLLGEEVRRHPGRRVPGHVGGAELAVRAVLGQQVSVEAARTHTARLVALYGTPLPAADGSLRFAFPTPAQLAAAGPELPGMAMPAARRRTIHGLAAALGSGQVPALRPGADSERVRGALGSLFGIGPWTCAYVAMRALADPDAFPAQDLGVARALADLTGRALSVREIERLSERWRPYRAYAVMHLWARHAAGSGSGGAAG